MSSLPFLSRHCLWILGNERTLARSDSIWQDLVNDARNRRCLFDAAADKCFKEIIIDVKKEVKPLNHTVEGRSKENRIEKNKGSNIPNTFACNEQQRSNKNTQDAKIDVKGKGKMSEMNKDNSSLSTLTTVLVDRQHNVRETTTLLRANNDMKPKPPPFEFDTRLVDYNSYLSMLFTYIKTCKIYVES